MRFTTEGQYIYLRPNYCLSNAMHGQNINLPVCLCVSVTLSVNSPTGQTPQQIFTVDSLKDADLRKDVPYSVSLASHVSTHLRIHLSAHLYYHHHSHHPSHLHFFTPGSKPTFSTNPSHLRLFYLPDCLHDNGTGPDLSCSSFYF